MANVETILATIDTRLAASMTLIETIQNDYFQEHGRYAQALFTHSTAPADESEAAPDQLEQSPTDQDETWNDLASGVMPATMLSRMKVDTYDGPSGKGYIVVLEKIINDDTYVRRINVGPESHHSQNWEKIS